MKKGALILAFLLIMPIALADITIITDQNIYNLGNKIKASASIIQSENFEGLFKLTISCDNYNLQYFLTPISLEPNFRTAVNVPELVASSSMLGNCTIIGELLTNDNLLVENRQSNAFSITRQLAVLPVKSKITALPDETLQINGVVNEAFGNNVLKTAMKIAMDNNTYTTDAINGKFNMTLGLQANIKSGRHTLEISAYDTKNNFGSALIELEITAIPTYIKIDISGAQLQPGYKVEIVSSLYDQADDLINASLDLELTSPSKSKVFLKAVQSDEQIGYEFSQYAEPGLYTLISSYKNLLAQSTINISTIRGVKIRYDNEVVLVENIGNVIFEDELTFILESESKKYPITKKVKVEPGKAISIDLSKEVPFGIYDVVLPVKEGLEPLKEEIDEKIKNLTESAIQKLAAEKEKLLAKDVTIHDDRPLYKKFASSFSSISSGLIGSDGILTKNPLIAPIILVVILLAVVFRYGRRPIMRLIKGKKDDENKENEA
ncbi:hypothetical protein HYX02_05845 [Candidatus Woesearchaeota archaeon]|nr:hypothetical protein [Candidatus Woesearchaeota archaeon]